MQHTIWGPYDRKVNRGYSIVRFLIHDNPSSPTPGNCKYFQKFVLFTQLKYKECVYSTMFTPDGSWGVFVEDYGKCNIKYFFM